MEVLSVWFLLLPSLVFLISKYLAGVRCRFSIRNATASVYRLFRETTRNMADPIKSKFNRTLLDVFPFTPLEAIAHPPPLPSGSGCWTGGSGALGVPVTSGEGIPSSAPDFVAITLTVYSVPETRFEIV